MNTTAFQRHLLAGLCLTGTRRARLGRAVRDHRPAPAAERRARRIRAARRDHQRFASRGAERAQRGRSRDRARRSAKLDADHQRRRHGERHAHLSSHAEPRGQLHHPGDPAEGAGSTQPIAFRVDKGAGGQTQRAPSQRALATSRAELRPRRRSPWTPKANPPSSAWCCRSRN